MTITFDLLVPIIIAIFGSQGFWTWLANRNSQSKQVLTEIKGLRAEFDMERAITARSRIIRFNDELLNDTKHSKEMFDQVLADIDTYEKYCSDNPKFLNNKTGLSIQNIKKVYQRCEDDRSFL